MRYLKFLLAIPFAIVLFSVMGASHATHASTLSYYKADHTSYTNNKQMTYDASYMHNTLTAFNYNNNNNNGHNNSNPSFSYMTENNLSYSVHFTLSQDISYQNSNVLAYQLNF